MNRPEIICLDWDGTLVDSFSFLQTAHNHVLNNFEMPVPAGDWFKEYFGKPRDFIYEDIYGDKEMEARRHFEKFIIANHVELIRPMPYAESLLKFLKAEGIPACIVSNKKNEFIHKEIAALQWDDYFVSVIGSGDAPRDKPYPDPLFKALRQVNPESAIESIWYAGDTEMDLLTAKNAGCPAVYIQPEEPDDRGLLNNYDILAIVKNCREIEELLLQTRQK